MLTQTEFPSIFEHVSLVWCIFASPLLFQGCFFRSPCSWYYSGELDRDPRLVNANFWMVFGKFCLNAAIHALICLPVRNTLACCPCCVLCLCRCCLLVFLVGHLNRGIDFFAGDHRYKQNSELTPEKQRISAEAEVTVTDLDPQTSACESGTGDPIENTTSDFFVLACDGIWECLENGIVISEIAERLFNHNLFEICHQVSLYYLFT